MDDADGPERISGGTFVPPLWPRRTQAWKWKTGYDMRMSKPLFRSLRVVLVVSLAAASPGFATAQVFEGAFSESEGSAAARLPGATAVAPVAAALSPSASLGAAAALAAPSVEPSPALSAAAASAAAPVSVSAEASVPTGVFAAEGPAASPASGVAAENRPAVAAPAAAASDASRPGVFARLGRLFDGWRGGSSDSAPAVSAPSAAPQIWSRKGSYPARSGNDVKILIDGQAAYADIAAAMNKAKKFIYSTYSYGDVNFLPVPETGETMFDLLRARSAAGVDVKLVVWQPALKTDGTIPDPAPGRIPGVDGGPGSIQARWDASPGYSGWYSGVTGSWRPMYLFFPPQLGCNHQKTYIMDDGEGGVVAFVGGINPVQSYWDTPAHDPLDARRVEKGADPLKGLESTPPLHDIFYRIQGPAVADVLSNFVERYNGASAPHRDAARDAVPPVTAAQIAPVAGGLTAQIVRTIAPGKYATLPKGDRGIKELYLNVLNAAKQGTLVYIENQYFFDHVIIDAIHAAADRGAKIVALLTSRPDEGTPQGKVESLMESVAKGETQGQAVMGHQNVVVMTLGDGVPDPRAPGKTLWSEIYIHSKNMFAFNGDWAAMAGGSANIAFTSMLFHAEMDVALTDPATVRDWVARLWSEHLRVTYEQAVALVKDPDAAFAFFKTRSAEDKAALDAGRAAPSRVFPFGTEFPSRQLAGISPENVPPANAAVAAK